MVHLRIKEVKIDTFKVKAEWSKSMIDDLSHFYGFDLQTSIEKEIRREIRIEKIRKVLERSLN